MRIMGGWIALTPELPAKLVLGRHVWDCAQHADLWGKRLPELRASAQRSEPANDRFVRFMDLIEAPEGYTETPERLAGAYLVLKPHLVAAYERHLSLANPVYEPPTCRILERCIAEERRHVAAGTTVIERIASGSAMGARREAWQQRLIEALHEAGGVTGDGAVDVRSTIGPTALSAGRDVAALDSTFDPSRIEPEFLERILAHARAIGAGRAADVARDLAPDIRDRILEEYAGLGSIVGDPSVVGCAVIGDYRIAKVRLPHADRVSVVQLRWRRSGEGWRLVDVAIARSSVA